MDVFGVQNHPFSHPARGGAIRSPGLRGPMDRRSRPGGPIPSRRHGRWPRRRCRGTRSSGVWGIRRRCGRIRSSGVWWMTWRCGLCGLCGKVKNFL